MTYHAAPACPRSRLRFRSLAALSIALTFLLVDQMTGIWPGSLSQGPTSASASTVSGLAHKAAVLGTEIDTARARLEVLDEEYNQAKLHLRRLDQNLALDQKAFANASIKVHRDEVKLRRQAISTYVDSGTNPAGGLTSVMTSTPDSNVLASTYLTVAYGNIDQTVTALHDAQHHLLVNHLVVEATSAKAKAAEESLAKQQHQAAAITQQLTTELQSVNSRIAASVAAAEQSAISRQSAAVAIRAAVSQAGGQGIPPQTGQTYASPIGSPSPTGAGAKAVAAARSQLGVPYQWAGSSPGQGFDCSGLTMWAWGQAGVNLPHSAAGQYASTTHVSLSDLVPGDLIYYASGGYIYHVIMYVGSGPFGTNTAIQAENTGTVIQYTPVWPGAYGASQP